MRAGPRLPTGERSEPISYDEQRMMWAASQTDTDIRSLAADYERGRVDECTTDAYAEYQRRFANKTNPSPKGSKAAKKRSTSRYK